MPETTPAEKARLRRLNIRLSQQEWDKVHKLSSNTTCRSVSEYARKLLLNKPVKVFYRNKSFDRFELQISMLLPHLERHGTEFSRLINKLTDQPDTLLGYQTTLMYLKACEQKFATTVSDIKAHIEKLSDLCDQRSPAPEA